MHLSITPHGKSKTWGRSPPPKCLIQCATDSQVFWEGISVSGNDEKVATTISGCLRNSLLPASFLNSACSKGAFLMMFVAPLLLLLFLLKSLMSVIYLLGMRQWFLLVTFVLWNDA